MSNFSEEKILASSKGWIASFLNFLPGLGSGYLYQRRWLPYFSTLAAVIAWLTLGIILNQGDEPSQTEQLIGVSGFFLISLVTLIEANLAHKKAVNKMANENEPINPSLNKRWFR